MARDIPQTQIQQSNAFMNPYQDLKNPDLPAQEWNTIAEFDELDENRSFASIIYTTDRKFVCRDWIVLGKATMTAFSKDGFNTNRLRNSDIIKDEQTLIMLIVVMGHKRNIAKRVLLVRTKKHGNLFEPIEVQPQ